MRNFASFFKKGRQYLYDERVKFGLGMAEDCFKVVICLHIMSHYICTVTVNSGTSNYPTLEAEGDIVLIYKAPYKLFGNSYEVGDVVMAISPIEPLKKIGKRIRAVEGDNVIYKRKGSPYSEIFSVPQGHVWLLGDNPNHSRDSRHYGPVPIGLIIGKAVFRFNIRTWSFSFIDDLKDTKDGRGGDIGKEDENKKLRIQSAEEMVQALIEDNNKEKHIKGIAKGEHSQDNSK